MDVIMEQQWWEQVESYCHGSQRTREKEKEKERWCYESTLESKKIEIESEIIISFRFIMGVPGVTVMYVVRRNFLTKKKLLVRD